MARLVLEQGSVRDLRRIADFTEAACAGYAVESRTLYYIKMAVDEACANIFEHAYGGKPGRMEIEATCSAAGLTVRIRDWGRVFDPATIRPPDHAVPLAERPVGGLGLFLIQQLMDRVEYRFDPHAGNCLTLEKELGG